jgi:hypothetical protein
MKLLDRPPNVIGTPLLLAHAAIFGQLPCFLKMGWSNAYGGTVALRSLETEPSSISAQ